MYGGFLIRGSTLTLTGGEICGVDTSWATPDGINMHKDLATDRPIMNYVNLIHHNKKLSINVLYLEQLARLCHNVTQSAYHHL